jgi:PPOX class probable F420-dependent enzyme
MATSFDEETRRLLDGKNFATLATVKPDGSPTAAVVWYQREDDALVFTSLRRRPRVRNIERNNRVSVTVFDLGNPYHAVEIRGVAEIIPDPEKRLSFQLSHRYLGVDPPKDAEGDERVIIRVVPEQVFVFKA